MTTDTILSPIAALTLPDSSALVSRAHSALAFIVGFEINSTEDYGFAADELQAIKARTKKLEEQRTSITGPMNKALDAVNDLFRQPKALLADGEALIKQKMLAWDQEQQRIAAEERRKAEEIAAAERARLAAEAAERQRVADEQAAAAAKAKAAGDEQAAALAAAAAQRAAAEAQAATANAQMVVAAVTTPAPTKVSGISTSNTIDFEVENLLELVKHVATHPEHIALLTHDSVRLRAYVKGLGTACALPGVRVFQKQVMSARAARAVA